MRLLERPIRHLLRFHLNDHTVSLDATRGTEYNPVPLSNRASGLQLSFGGLTRPASIRTRMTG